jgi:hypothetical protein
MTDVAMSGEEDRIVIELHHGDEPIELGALTDSLAALASLYGRHYRKDEEAAPKLYVTRLQSGSVIAEIAPYVEMFGHVVGVMSAAVTIVDFARMVTDGIKVFSSPTEAAQLLFGSGPQGDDTKLLREFIKPLAGKAGARLGIRHARFHKADGKRELTVVYEFDEREINRAALAMDRSLDMEADSPSKGMKPHYEVMLFFDSASRGPGKEAGRTRDFAVVPEVSPKPLPVHFRSGVEGNLKDVMVRGDVNPLTDVAYIVDVHAQLIDDQPRGYIVTQVHRSVPLPDEAQ